jgi:putative transcriptional regulator
MADVLESQRTATRFRILVAIASRQPAVSQGEIADTVGVTSQAVSEYIRELVDDGHVEKEARGRYRVTKEGVDWLFGAAESMRRLADHVTGDVLGGVNEDAAIASAAIEAGETVSLSLRDGLLHAEPGDDGAATGVATTDAAAGDVVSVTDFAGVIDIDPGEVRVVQVPSTRSGGVGDPAAIATRATDADLRVAAGVEAITALQATDTEYATHFAPGEVAADAAGRGLDVVVVATTDELGRVTDALRDAGVSYEVTDGT